MLMRVVAVRQLFPPPPSSSSVFWKGKVAVSSSSISSFVSLYGGHTPIRMFSTPGAKSKDEKSFVDDRSLNYVLSTESEYELGKHRSNALELVMKQPIIYVDGDTAICDGGGGALGHPVAYINVAHTGDEGEPCPYCSLRYAKRKKL